MGDHFREPEFRSFLMAYTYVGQTVGALFAAVLNTLMPWRIVALVCAFVPILTTTLLCVIPESPLCLLSKKRTDESLKALSWLRGWTSQEAAADEFQALQRYNDRAKSCKPCIKQKLNCSHPLPTLIEKLKQIKRKQIIKPCFIVLILLVIMQLVRTLTIRAFIVQIFKAYESPIPPDHATALLNFMNNIANFVFLFLVHFFRKRRLYLTMLSIVFLCGIITSFYGFAVLPLGYNSFDLTGKQPLTNKLLAYIPFVCVILGSFFSFCGIYAMPSQMLSELLPFKVRGVVSGFIITFSYMLAFILTKTRYFFEVYLSLPGITLLLSIIIGFGLILLYYILPETTNRSLEDIELHFADNSKKLTNRKIKIHVISSQTTAETA